MEHEISSEGKTDFTGEISAIEEEASSRSDLTMSDPMRIGTRIVYSSQIPPLSGRKKFTCEVVENQSELPEQLQDDEIYISFFLVFWSLRLT
ncbi:Oidioi.mRNA.OKI2018_I69.chr1.g1836.t1.cds [Oikopleura dioica]|uniref:Oidioi.mRNA.OKI2018_I69.chr1.g1836.t1.cds n=1 Tax=Oikopleura dioica TaxID=34765 RepID=A0ABN7SVF2_OIKDI|nr:Oidioi.mRNA.OKI2018_I69.chr1.g1836.t1.cds [Oikopleura dioica]